MEHWPTKAPRSATQRNNKCPCSSNTQCDRYFVPEVYALGTFDRCSLPSPLCLSLLTSPNWRPKCWSSVHTRIASPSLVPWGSFSLKRDRSTTSTISETEQQQQHQPGSGCFPCSKVPIPDKNDGVAELKRAGQGAPGEPINFFDNL